MSSASALHLSLALSIPITARSGTSVSLRYAKDSARWMKPARTAEQTHTCHINSDSCKHQTAGVLTITVHVFQSTLTSKGVEQSLQL